MRQCFFVHKGHYTKLIHAPSPRDRWDDVGCSYCETFPKDVCVIAHGDIEFVNRIRQRRVRFAPSRTSLIPITWI